MGLRAVGTVVAIGALLAACSDDGEDAATTTAAATTVATVAPEPTDAPDTAPAATVSVETGPHDSASESTDAPSDTAPAETDAPADTEAPTTTATGPTLRAGAASRSVLPTVGGMHSFLLDAPGWDDLDPDDIGVFVVEWDQGEVDVGNGSSDGSWVHDDLRATALALESGGELFVMVATDLYMVFATDAAEIELRAREQLPEDVAESARIIISATHNHHGPDTAFSINHEWYDHMADRVVDAIVDAVSALEPATVSTAAGEHRFGVSDGRDPIVLDPRLNVMTVEAADDGTRIATVVQWASHPETTLGWDPPVDITEQCAVKGWEGDDCTAEGRYFTADYPGVLRERLIDSAGGEVLYLNGAVGNQIGPGDADVWLVDDEHPVGNGWTAPEGAQPVAGGTDHRTENFARTEAIGAQLATAVEALAADAEPLEVEQITWAEQPFYTNLTNIGFRLLLADGDLGWQTPELFTCSEEILDDEHCVSDEGRVVDDPVLTPLVESQIREGEVLRTRLVHLDLGDVGFLFMPGELPPELVVGLPATFVDDPAPFYLEPDLHAVGADYAAGMRGYLLELVDDDQTFTVGLGGDELGYFVPITDVRLKCLELVFPDPAVTCQSLFDVGVLITPDALPATICRDGTDDPAVAAICRYGQALGRELGEPPGHYEETNSAGWDLVDDLLAAAELLFQSKLTSGGVNPDNPGHTPSNPPAVP